MGDVRTDDKEITLFLTDDHQSVVEGLIALLAQDSKFKVVGHCNDGKEAVLKVPQLQPDVLVLDVSMPGMNGLEVCRLVKEIVPKVHVVMLTMHCSEKLVSDALQRGASGYVMKESVHDICNAVHRVYGGGIYVPQGTPQSVLEMLEAVSVSDGADCAAHAESHS